MMFNKIRAQIIAEYNHYKETQAGYISEYSNSRLADALTPAKRRDFLAGKLTEEEAVTIAIARNNKRLDKDCKQELERLDRYEKAPKIREICIDIEWKRSTTWGYNPTATVQVWTDGGYFTAEGRASGCGYDKRSAAVGSALNQISAVIAALCAVKEANITEEKTTSNQCICYGAGYGAIPYFEGGVGISCHHEMLKLCGLEKTADHGTKYTDYYRFECK